MMTSSCDMTSPPCAGAASYYIPTVAGGLSRLETLAQMHDVLAHVRRVSEHVLARVQARVDTCGARAAAVRRRVHVASSQLERLKRSDQPVQLVSSAKYPASETADLAVWPRIFDRCHTVPQLHWSRPTNYLHSATQLCDSASVPMEPPDQVKLLTRQPSMTSRDDVTVADATMPSHLPSISSLLVVDSGEYAYACDEFASETGTSTGAVLPVISELTETAAVAPPSPFSVHAADHHNSGDEFWYEPVLADELQLSAPVCLPTSACVTLPPATIIQSSQTTTDNTTGNTVVSAGNTVVSTGNTVVSAGNTVVSAGNTVVSTGNTSMPVSGLTSDNINSTLSHHEDVQPAHPPTPPPAPPLPVATLVSRDTAASMTSSAPAAVDDSRSALMEAIRQAGGVGGTSLRAQGRRPAVLSPSSASVQVLSPSSASVQVLFPSSASVQNCEAVASVSGGDLMSDLAAKLALRRKGISGDIESAVSGDATAVMHRVSSLIPPPPPPSSSGSSHLPPLSSTTCTDVRDHIDASDEWE